MQRDSLHGFQNIQKIEVNDKTLKSIYFLTHFFVSKEKICYAIGTFSFFEEIL